MSYAHRDARRVVQVLVPGVPPPVLDYVFASITKTSRGSRSASSDGAGLPPARYMLRSCDGGPGLWGPSLLESAASADVPIPWRQNYMGSLEFHYNPPAPPPTAAQGHQ
ncbi:hypothetical protein Vretimale_15515 [Volvox reticuliferus]|uniref:Uncharacterized protein n=1 Tax=Volvox reticuliferus TaxID=1737510 RepID=A0A8J4GQW9_9CHLO|nr:hypothetical protein Vretifemale_15157 [Volvox reticuliferus]GIM12084.1 hypothetical protein Vretimale_15515 [Volvox reticuliferus]